MNYKVWHCKLVTVAKKTSDAIPRNAAIEAVNKALGEEVVVSCFSDWDDNTSTLTESEMDAVSRNKYGIEAKVIFKQLGEQRGDAQKIAYIERLLIQAYE